MLAATAELSALSYPVLASTKLDGVRAVVVAGIVYSRTFKPIPNQQVQRRLGCLEGYDGELILGSPTAWNCYRKTVSAVMTESNEDDVDFHVFDRVDQPQLSYVDRYESINKDFRHEHCPIYGDRDLLDLESRVLSDGYEGLILRHPGAPYKYGRSTLKQGWMLKLKRFTDAEATVVGFEELETNLNPAMLDERGYTKRSHHQANKIPMGTLGALIVKMDGQQFSIGTGFTQAERQDIWSNRSNHVGQLAKFKYFNIGIKDSPRHPVWLGWRHKEDV